MDIFTRIFKEVKATIEYPILYFIYGSCTKEVKKNKCKEIIKMFDSLKISKWFKNGSLNGFTVMRKMSVISVKPTNNWIYIKV